MLPLPCSNDSGDQFYVSDTTFFHGQNCDLPRYVPVIFTVFYSICWTIILALLVPRIRDLKKPGVSFIARCTLAYHVVLECLMLSVTAQGGFYEFAAVFLTLSYIFMLVLMTVIMLHMLQFSNVLHSTKVERMKSVSNTLMGIGICIEIAFGLSVMHFARTEYHNHILLTFILVHQSISGCSTVLCYKYTNEFVAKALKDGGHSELLERILGMRNTWIMILGGELLIPTLIGAAWAMYGFLPHQWIVIYFCQLSGTIASLGILPLLPSASSKVRKTIPDSRGPPAGKNRVYPSSNDDIRNDPTLPISNISAQVFVDTDILPPSMVSRSVESTRNSTAQTIDVSAQVYVDPRFFNGGRNH